MIENKAWTFFGFIIKKRTRRKEGIPRQPRRGAMNPTLCEIVHGVKEGQGEPLDAMREALSRGADPGGACPWTGRSVLMLCAQRGWSRCAATLLRAGADPKKRDQYGRDALMLALIAREVECAKILAPVSRPRWRDAKGRSAMALAALHAPRLRGQDREGFRARRRHGFFRRRRLRARDGGGARVGRLARPRAPRGDVPLRGRGIKRPGEKEAAREAPLFYSKLGLFKAWAGWPWAGRGRAWRRCAR